jgi:hypothetical protein
VGAGPAQACERPVPRAPAQPGGEPVPSPSPQALSTTAAEKLSPLRSPTVAAPVAAGSALLAVAIYQYHTTLEYIGAPPCSCIPGLWLLHPWLCIQPPALLCNQPPPVPLPPCPPTRSCPRHHPNPPTCPPPLLLLISPQACWACC